MNKEILEHLINVENMTYMLLNDEQKKKINDDKIKNLEAKKRIYQKEVEKLEKKVILDRTHLTEIRHEETKIPRYIPSYEELEQELERYKNIIDELKWKPIEEYEKPKYDWVLVKYFIEPNFECIPCVAENRFGKWYDRNDNLINGEVRYFADMQLLDTLEELKGE